MFYIKFQNAIKIYKCNIIKIRNFIQNIKIIYIIRFLIMSKKIQQLILWFGKNRFATIAQPIWIGPLTRFAFLFLRFFALLFVFRILGCLIRWKLLTIWEKSKQHQPEMFYLYNSTRLKDIARTLNFVIFDGCCFISKLGISAIFRRMMSVA